VRYDWCVTVSDVGIADALRAWRRRRRLSQFELAMRAGTTQRHVSFVESGRSVPGRGLILRLAEALDVPLRERNALLADAGYAPAFRTSPLTDPGLAPLRAALERVLDGHLPSPAVLTDRDNDVVSSNAAFDVLVASAAPDLLAPPVNVSRLLLSPRGLAPRIENLSEWGWHVIDALRLHADHDDRPRLAALAEELLPALPERPSDGPPLGFAVPLLLRADGGGERLQLLTTHTTFRTAIDVTVSELTLEAFLPADEPTARALAAAM
jgi:transcriptional regulator with XRE-family HTH domain